MQIYLISLVAYSSTSDSVSGSGCILSVKTGSLVSASSCLQGHVQQYNIFELLHDMDYDKYLGFLVYSRFKKVIGVSLSRFPFKS